ncbi:unnamed protein product [Mucor hiemalis]
MAFCSISCQSKEASKSFVSSYAPFNSKLLNNNTMHLHSSSVRPSSGKPSSSYQMSYHRRPSLSYSSSTATTTSTNRIDTMSKRKKDSIERLSSSLSTTNRPPPFFLMQSLSTSSSFSSSISDASVFSTSCSCEDKAGNACPPYHITRTTHNIAS